MICIIPARKGSKGLKDKNIKKLNGKSLILHTIHTAKKCKSIKKIIVSTDDDRIIKKINKIEGVDIPFKRPSRLSKDNSIAIDAYLHCINFLERKNKIKIENFCVMLPTCPIRNPKDIEKTIKIFYSKKPDFLVSVKETPPKEYIYVLDKKGYLKILSSKKNKLFNRQELDHTYTPNGSIYICNTKKLKKYKTFFTKKTYCYKMDKKFSVDIDTIEDFNLAKSLI
jgi:CMP-N-acetylneuraminic acid synthetase